MNANLRTMTDTELQAAVDVINEQLNAHHSTYNETTDKCLGSVDYTIPYWARYKEIEAPRLALYKEMRRRQSNATREKNATQRTAQAVAAGTFSIGEAVQVHAFGTWYNGTVTKLGRTGKVTVKYTSGTGVTREKAVDSTKIRKVGA